MEEESRKIKEEKKQLKKDVEAFKNLLFKEEKKEEKPPIDEYIEAPRPEEEIADAIRQSEEYKEETVVEHAVKILDKINEEVETVETEPDLAKLKKEIEILKQVVYEQGGGGEVRLEFLDDVDRDTALLGGRFLQYESSTKKFIGGDPVGAGSTWKVDSVGIHTTKNVGIGTSAKSGFALDVLGNARITGILTIGTQTITLDPSSDIIQVGTGITIDANNEKIIVGNSEVADSTGNAKFTGIVTAKSFTGFDQLAAPYSSTTTITVTVASKVDGEHRYYGQGSSQGYVLDNVQSPFLTLTPGRTYRFDVSDSSNSGHPFRFYLDAAKATAYTTGVTVGSGYVDLEVTDSTPTILHYQCSSHGYMGNAIQVNSSNAIKLNSQAASYYLDYDNFSNTPTIPSNNNQLTNGAGYITTSFTNTNQLTNGAGFITASDDITGNAATSTLATNAQGLTGTPSISVTNVTASGNVNIAGVLTYEDVTNVDSIGIVTARAGVLVGSGITLSKDGDVFATGITSSTKVHVGVDTGVYGEDLVVTGDARVTGILTIGTGSIVLDPTAKQLRGLEEIVIGIANTITIKQDDKGEIEFTDAVGTPKSVGIGTTVSVNTSGIITASSFVGGFTGDLTGTASNATTAANAVTLNDLAGSHYLNYNNFTNTPTIPSNNNQLTNGAGFITGSALNASNLNSGTIPDARFPSTLPAISGANLTGIAVTDNIRTNTNATFLQNVNVSGTTTATTFIGDLTGDVTGDVTGTASNATLAVSAQGLTGSPSVTVTNVNAVDAIISGNLSVAGTITSLDQNDISVTGIMTASAGVDLGDPGVVTLSSDTLTTTSTSTDTVSSISATVFRSATFQVQVTRGTQYHMTTINVIHNGTVAFMSEYGTIRTGAVLATFDADINSGNLRLRATPTSADSTVFKLSKTTIKV